MRKFLLASSLLASIAFAFVACGDDDEVPQVCADIGSPCHELGETNAQAENCHEVGHDGNAAACEAIHDECVALCSQTGADAGPDAADEDAGE